MSGPVYVSKLEERNIEHRKRLNEVELFRQRAAEIHAKQQLLQDKNDAATAEKEDFLLKKREEELIEEQLVAQDRANNELQTKRKEVIFNALNKSILDREYPLVDRLEVLISLLIKILEVKQLDVNKKVSEEKLCYREINEVIAILGVIQKAVDIRNAALRHLNRRYEEALTAMKEALERDIAVLLQERKALEDLSKDLSELFPERPM